MLTDGMKNLIELMIREEEVIKKPIKNVKMKIKKNILTITIDLKNNNHEKTLTGKSEIIATTRNGKAIVYDNKIMNIQLKVK